MLDTGERPYQCSLCEETFCRSDILKRHFAKCSIRRGNPHGLTHLTHARAPPRTAVSLPGIMPSQSGGVPVSGPSNPSGSVRTSWSGGTPVQAQYNQDPSQVPSGLLGSNGSSRSNSIIRPASSGSDDKKRYAVNGLAPLPSGLASAPPQSNTEALTAQDSDRKYGAFQYSRDRIPAQNYQENQNQNFYNQTNAGAAPMNPQSQQNPGFAYQRGGVPQYGVNPAQPNGTMKTEDWSTYFQTGAQDPPMFLSQ